MSIEQSLTGGDPRSLGHTEEVVELVLKDKKHLSELFECLFSDDPIVRMRAGDALEKVCRQKPEWFVPFVPRLISEVAKIDQASVMWHLAQMLAEVKLSPAQTKEALKILNNNLKTSDDWIVTNLTLESLATFVRRGDFSREQFNKILDHQLNSRHKSVAARARNLLKEFKD